MSGWEEWHEQHKNDIPLLPKRIRAMHGMYGATPGQICKTCVHLDRYRGGTRFMKCNLSRVSHSTATDWRANWPACGKFEEEK